MTLGYHVRRSALRRSAGGYEDGADQLRQWRAELRAVLEEEGNPLGDDQYGAALAKRLPQVTDELFGAFDAYIAELDGVGSGLTDSAANYEAAEHASSVSDG
ncbi:hypothetical protein ACTMTI_01315 [Nonomuraea sp. H19]|uniref:hypothetical protein n=1 Tax=Nonomuraea sp. H19 TaxID=3452206 RepID=UPI003F8CB3E9